MSMDFSAIPSSDDLSFWQLTIWNAFSSIYKVLLMASETGQSNHKPHKSAPIRPCLVGPILQTMCASFLLFVVFAFSMSWRWLPHATTLCLSLIFQWRTFWLSILLSAIAFCLLLTIWNERDEELSSRLSCRPFSTCFSMTFMCFVGCVFLHCFPCPWLFIMISSLSSLNNFGFPLILVWSFQM